MAAMTRMIGVSTLVAFGAAVCWAQASGEQVARLPTYRTVQQRLEVEIRKLIDAGHLAPGLATFEQHYRYESPLNLSWKMDDYWHNPAELVYTLTLAMPFLPPGLQAEAKAYLKAEFELFPSTDIVHIGPEGARREYSDIPEEYAEGWPVRYGQLPDARERAYWDGWAFNPFNIYACAKYAEVFPSEARSIFERIQGKVAPLPSDADFLRERPHVVNVYIAGYFGYLDLQSQIGQQESDQVRQWLRDALQLRIELLREGTAHLNGAEAGGFLWLTPELGDYLHQNAASLAERAVEEYDWAAPYWFVSNAQETTRYRAGGGFMEGYHAHVYDAVSQFQARALVLKYSRAQLEPMLDASSVARGDLYYIQNLTATLAADGVPPPAPSGPARPVRSRQEAR